jgi:sugar/nucleoside kinase (ribokinase family)
MPIGLSRNHVTARDSVFRHKHYSVRVDAVLPRSAPTLWFVGLTTLDVIHRGVAPAHRNQKVTASWQGVSAGGPAANAAVVAATLGANAYLFTALGSSPAAAIARADLEQHAVQVIDYADDDFEFPVSAILVDEATSERSVVSLDGGLWNPDLNFSVEERLRPILGPIEPSWPDAILFDGHHPNLARAMLERLDRHSAARSTATARSINSATQDAEPRKPMVILDGGRWKPIFAELIPSATVAALSSDFKVPDGKSVLELGAQAVVVTNGPSPVQWETSTGKSGSVPVPQVQALDTLGAGDAFHGALTYYLACQDDLPSAVAKANQVAATKVQYLGNRDWLKFI